MNETLVPRVTAVKVLHDHWVRLTFADGLVRDVDLGPTLWGPAFREIAGSKARFAEVFVDRAAGTIAWPGGVDLDPVVLRGDAVPAH